MNSTESTEAQDLLSIFEGVAANANRLAAKVGDDQWSSDTPCSEWNTRQLVNHMAGTCNFFVASAGRVAPAGTPDDDHVGDDPVGGLATATANVVAAWHAEGALEGMVTAPGDMPAVVALGINLLDVGTHCWDLAQSIGEDHGLTAEQIGAIDHWNRAVINDEVRSGGGFGDPIEVDDDSSLVQMLAFVGRKA